MEQYSKNYANNEHDFENVMVVMRRKKILDILRKYNPKNILEIGCGMDSLFNYYTSYNHFTIVEPALKFFNKACEDAQNNLKITLINDFLENQVLDLQKEKFDFIICSSLLHEIKNPKEFLKQIHFLADEKCLIHINVPNSKSFHLIWAYKSGLIKQLGKLSDTAKTLQQNTTFDLDSLIDMIKDSGDRYMKILNKGSYFIKPFNHAKMSQCLKENILNDELLDGLYSMVEYMPEMGAEIYVNYKIS